MGCRQDPQSSILNLTSSSLVLLGFQGVQDPGQQSPQQPDKVGWIRKFCGRGIFRELWRNRFMVLRGEHLYISEKEVRHPHEDGSSGTATKVQPSGFLVIQTRSHLWTPAAPQTTVLSQQGAPQAPLLQ